MMSKGEGVKGKAVPDVLCLCEAKKRQKKVLRIDLTYYQGNKTCIHTPVV